MGTRDPRVDAYIAKAPDFARPILTHVRDVVHDACPDVVETIKWSRPFFDHRGPLANMSAFKEHCSFGLWKHAQVMGSERVDESAGSFGRLTTVQDLPPKRELVRIVKQAAALNEDGAPKVARKTAPKPTLAMPDDFAAALDAHATARAAFDGFSPSHRREYLEWITEAKSAATRERRMAQAVEWLAEGKPRHWKYQAR